MSENEEYVEVAVERTCPLCGRARTLGALARADHPDAVTVLADEARCGSCQRAAFLEIPWVGAGWMCVVREAARRMAAIDPECTLDQVKEKWNDLRIYAAPSNLLLRDKAALEAFNAVEPWAEEFADTICATCALPAAGCQGHPRTMLRHGKGVVSIEVEHADRLVAEGLARRDGDEVACDDAQGVLPQILGWSDARAAANWDRVRGAAWDADRAEIARLRELIARRSRPIAILMAAAFPAADPVDTYGLTGADLAAVEAMRADIVSRLMPERERGGTDTVE